MPTHRRVDLLERHVWRRIREEERVGEYVDEEERHLARIKALLGRTDFVVANEIIHRLFGGSGKSSFLEVRVNCVSFLAMGITLVRTSRFSRIGGRYSKRLVLGRQGAEKIVPARVLNVGQSM